VTKYTLQCHSMNHSCKKFYKIGPDFIIFSKGPIVSIQSVNQAEKQDLMGPSAGINKTS
jgi:hypothetical protein